MDLEIIVLSYNHPELTARTLLSLQNFFKKLTLIHNGSIPKNVLKLQKQFPNVHHIVLPINLGFTGGSNAGLTHGFTKSDWVLFVTNDCILKKIGTLPKIPAIVGTKVFIHKSNKIDNMGGIFVPEKAQLTHCWSDTEFQSGKGFQYIPGSCFLIHKKIFEITGGFDESLGTYWEDVDISVRSQKLGFPVYIDPNWIFEHSIGKTCRKNSQYTIYYYHRNKIRVCLKYCTLPKIPLLLLVLVSDFIKTFIKLLRSKRYADIYLLTKAYINI